MGAKLPSGWKIIKQHRVSILVVTIILVVAIALIILGYRFDWTGFNGNNKSGKTLWDWMQLLFIPVVLAFAGFLFNHRERKAAELRTVNERQAAELRAEENVKIEQQRAKAEQEIAAQRYEQDQLIALDKQRQDLLQAYLDRMSELLLEKNLRTSPSEEVRNVARVRTTTILTQLDERRIGYVFGFLREAGLMSTTSNDNAVSLSKADLHAVNWSRADLSRANLSGAMLWEADLSETDLEGANLSKADLEGADLSEANLKDAIGITIEELEKQAKSLKGATMPDGSIHP